MKGPGIDDRGLRVEQKREELSQLSSFVMADGIRVVKDAPCEMRDGVKLRSDLYLPREPGKYPTLLMRVPYNKTVAQSFVYQHPSWYARHGYLVVVQDCRGRHASDGFFNPLWQEAEDGYDSVEWAARLSESNGNVGTYGFSYAGATQLLAAAEQPPALKCCAPALTASDYYDDWMYEGGAFNLAFVVSWVVQMLLPDEAKRSGKPEKTARVNRALHDFPDQFRQRPLTELPVIADTGLASYFSEWLRHDTRDDYWTGISVDEKYDQILVPCLHIGGWYDVFARGTIKNYLELNRRAADDESREQRLIMGPWIHTPWASEATGQWVGDSGSNVVDHAQLRWFDKWLKPESHQDLQEPAVTYYAMGNDRWQTAERWPPSGTAGLSLYLRSSGMANSRSGDGALSTQPGTVPTYPDVYIYDPGNPVVSAGGNSCCNPAVSPMGQACQAGTESRNDVLVYSSEPQETPLEVDGSPRVVLYAASSEVDTDWVARLVDVAPNGRAINVCQGILRARFRNSLGNPSPLVPNKIYRYELTLSPTSWVFKTGHRVRLQITSSDFPAHEPNLNTGVRSGATASAEARVATQSVHHGEKYLSVLELPSRVRAYDD